MTFHLPFTGGNREGKRERKSDIHLFHMCVSFIRQFRENKSVRLRFIQFNVHDFLHSRGDFHYYLTISLALLFFYQQNETHLHQFFILRGSKFEMDYICRPATTITLTSMDINQMVKYTHMCVCVSGAQDSMQSC